MPFSNMFRKSKHSSSQQNTKRQSVDPDDTAGGAYLSTVPPDVEASSDTDDSDPSLKQRKNKPRSGYYGGRGGGKSLNLFQDVGSSSNGNGEWKKYVMLIVGGYLAIRVLGGITLGHKHKVKELREFHVNQCNDVTLQAIDSVNTVDWRNRNSRCPGNLNWLDEHYSQKQFKIMEEQRSADDSSDDDDEEIDHFVGMTIGCDMGYNAIKKMRMGSFNAALDLEAWRSKINMHDKCDTHMSKQFGPIIFRSSPITNPEWHCIEPMNTEYNLLAGAASALNYDVEYGFGVTQAFVTNENAGMKEKCVSKPDRKDCAQVESTTLDSLVPKIVSSVNQRHNIDIVNIDNTAGYDMEVLLGAKDTLKHKIQYLEFEYNNQGVWPNYELKQAIDFLDDADFTCYFAAQSNQLIRITQCWLDQYNTRSLETKITCVKRTNFVLAVKMESIHQEFVKDALTQN